MKSLQRMFLLVYLILVAGCATTKTPKASKSELEQEADIQRAMELNSTLRYQKRLDRIAYPILRGGRSYCNDKVTAGLGMRVANRNAFPENLRDAAAREFALDGQLQVLWMLGKGPADAAGIRAGDRIVRVGGTPIPNGDKGLKKYRKVLRAAVKEDGPVVIGLLRNGQSLSYRIKPDRVCDYPVVAVLDATPNAYADGSMIAVNSGLLRLFEEDRDVAIVLGHELAHNVKEHMAKGMLVNVLGALVELALDIDYVAGMVSAPFSPPLEAEADYVGLYIAASSGVDIQGAENVWRIFAAEFSGAKEKTLTDTHPPTPERYVALRKTIEEIRQKKQKGLPLKPNR